MGVSIKRKSVLAYVGKKAGDQQLQTSTIRYSTISGEAVVAYAAKSANVPESSIRQCALALKDAIAYFVVNGHHVQLNKFGTFGFRSRAKAVMKAEDITPNLIHFKGLRFIPSVELKEIMSATKLNCVLDESTSATTEEKP